MTIVHQEIYGEWIPFDGREVTVRGRRYRLRVRQFRQRYPYEADMLQVYADPLDRDAEYYDTRRQLGDDWSVDVIGSDLDFECAVCEALGIE